MTASNTPDEPCAIPLGIGRWLLLSSDAGGPASPACIAEGSPDTLRIHVLRGASPRHSIRVRRPLSLMGAVQVARAAGASFKPPRWGLVHPPTARLPRRLIEGVGFAPSMLTRDDAAVWLSDPATPRFVNRLHDDRARGCWAAEAALAEISAATQRALSLDPRA